MHVVPSDNSFVIVRPAVLSVSIISQFPFFCIRQSPTTCPLENAGQRLKEAARVVKRNTLFTLVTLVLWFIPKIIFASHEQILCIRKRWYPLAVFKTRVEPNVILQCDIKVHHKHTCLSTVAQHNVAYWSTHTFRHRHSNIQSLTLRNSQHTRLWNV